VTNRKSVYQACPPHSHLQGEDDILVKAGPLLKIIPGWQELLSTDLTEEEYKTLRRHERSGRPLGSDDFITRLEKLTSRTLNKQKPGPKKNN
jgi:putative transposase